MGYALATVDVLPACCYELLQLRAVWLKGIYTHPYVANQVPGLLRNSG